MNKRIFAILIILIATFTVTTVCAGEELVSHDFGQFKMDIPDNQNVSETMGGSKIQHPIYAIQNSDLTNFAYVDYINTTYINGNTTNTTDFVLNTIKENNTVKMENGTPTWVYKDTGDNGYLISSDDDSQVLIIQGRDVHLQEAINSIEFK